MRLLHINNLVQKIISQIYIERSEIIMVLQDIVISLPNKTQYKCVQFLLVPLRIFTTYGEVNTDQAMQIS